MVATFLNTYVAESKLTVEIDSSDLSTYSEVIRKTLNNSNVIFSNKNKPTYNNLNVYAKKAFDVEAKGALDSGLAKHFYPHFLATTVIVYDQSIIRENILSWSDLSTTKYEVGFLENQENLQAHLSSISYGLEKKDYTLKSTLDLLSILKSKDLLRLESQTSPITICFDYEAVKLKEENKNLEIIIPSEGTLTFEGGILAKEKLEFSDNIDEVLIKNGFRPQNNNKNLSGYPSESKYKSASKVENFSHFSKYALKTTASFSRQVLNERPFTSIDRQEHLMVALAYLMIVTFWTASVIYRSTQKPIIYAAVFTGLILCSWTLVRLVRYQIVDLNTLSRYLWYSYYIFQIFIPLIILWMAWSMDRPNTYIRLPNWWFLLIAFAFSLIILVFTNDYHNLVLVLDLSSLDWGNVYSYGIGYFIILFFAFSILLSAFVTLIIKGLKTPNRNIFSIPLIIFVLFAIYNYMYITRVPIIYQTDITIVTGFFTMVMFESNIRFGLIPVNTRYISLFKLSPLKIQIFDKDKNLLLQSIDSKKPKEKHLDKLLKPDSAPNLDENNLIFSKSIPGGHALWYEDISNITTLYNKILENNKLLEAANVMLAQKKHIQSKINDQLLKQEILNEFELDLTENINKVSEVVDDLESDFKASKNIARLPLLLTYIKRRSNLFFVEKKSKDFKIEIFNEYIEELSNIAAMANTKIALYNEISDNLSTKQASLLYDFFYKVVEAAVEASCLHIINYISDNEDKITMQLLPSKNLKEIVFDEKLLKAIKSCDGIFSQKAFEDTVGFTVSFKKGGRSL